MEVATLSKDQEFNSTADDNKNMYEIRVGNNDGFLPKADATLTSDLTQHLTEDRIYHPIIKYCMTKNITPVFSNPTKPFVQIAVLPKDERYPMTVMDHEWLSIDIGGKMGYVQQNNVVIDDGIPVLTYHHLLEKSENKLYRNSSTTITPESFNQQMGYLYQQHFTSITTGDIENYLNGKVILPNKTVLITFDDGLQSVYRYAYPVLKKYHLKATEFMITGRIFQTPMNWNPDKAYALSYPEMDKMKDVFEFNSHTNNLHNKNINKKSDVVTMPYNTVKADIALSQRILHTHSFAYPFGEYNMQSIQILKELGFKSAFTTEEGYAKAGDNPYLIPRFIITPKISLATFKYLVNL
jgi:peptidoglycan/xylan/chitin deacetylase (PgdA/CDA1 family)